MTSFESAQEFSVGLDEGKVVAVKKKQDRSLEGQAAFCSFSKHGF